MRLTVEKILKQGYKPTTHSLCSGFIDDAHVSVIVPRSEEAKMLSMIEGGLDLDDEKNYTFYNSTMDTVGSVEGKPFASQISGQKIVRILKAAGLAPEIPEDLYMLIKKAVQVRKHLERNRQDKDSKFRLILIESRIHRLARYYRTTRKLPANWRYESATASTMVA